MKKYFPFPHPGSMGKKEIASLYPTRFLGSSKKSKIREDKREPLIFNTPRLQLPTQHLSHTAC